MELETTLHMEVDEVHSISRMPSSESDLLNTTIVSDNTVEGVIQFSTRYVQLSLAQSVTGS